MIRNKDIKREIEQIHDVMHNLQRQMYGLQFDLDNTYTLVQGLTKKKYNEEELLIQNINNFTTNLTEAQKRMFKYSQKYRLPPFFKTKGNALQTVSIECKIHNVVTGIENIESIYCLIKYDNFNQTCTHEWYYEEGDK